MIDNEQTTENMNDPECAEKLAQLASVPGTIRRLIGDRTSDELRQPGQDGGDAVVEVLCHLQDWEEITGERVWRILNENTPELESFDDSLWSIEHDYISRDGLQALEAFTIARDKLMETLDTLDAAAWQRTAALGDHGIITLTWLIEKIAGHDEKHLMGLGEALN